MNLRRQALPRVAVLAAAGLSLACLGCRRPVEPPPPSDGVAVDALLSTNALRVGDSVRLTAVARFSGEGRVVWPDLGRDKAVVVRRTFPADTSTPGRVRQVWDLTSFRVGSHAAWTGMVQLIRTDGSTNLAALPPLSLRVISLLTDPPGEPRDIKPLADWPRRPMTTALWILAAVALIALLAGLAARRLRRRPVTTPGPPPAPPHEVALLALAALRQRGWIAAGLVEPFYVEVSSIVRRYLEDRFHLHAPEQTTEEFIRSASGSRLLSLDHQQLVTAFLEQCDLVKFARHRPGAVDMEAALAAAERLVRETVTQPIPPLPPAS